MVLADEPDGRILECALAATARIIVTGDRAMLALGEQRGVRIISLGTYLGRPTAAAPSRRLRSVPASPGKAASAEPPPSAGARAPRLVRAGRLVATGGLEPPTSAL